jgi:hypothetical protein
MAATIAIAEAYSFYRFKWDFDKWYRERRFDLLEHICLTVNTVPSLAVSAAYSTFDTMKSLPNRLNPPTVILNVFPVSNNKTIALFSFKKAHREYFIPHIRPIVEADGHYQKYLLSKATLLHCENFVLGGHFFAGLAETRKAHIERFFGENLAIQKADRDDADFYLFGEGT